MNSLEQKKPLHCLYITYDGLLDPLGRTQVLPYILGLSEVGFRFTILSFEKSERDPRLICELADQLRSKNILWIHLPFVRGRFQGIVRLLRGANAVRQIAKKDPFALAHLRTIVSGVIYQLAFVRTPFIYDIRAFCGQWVDVGRLDFNSFAYRFLSWLEDRLIRDAAGLVVLDLSGFEYLRKTYRLRPPVKIIPTSAELCCFDSSEVSVDIQACAEVRFVFLGGARFPYLPLQALQFIQSLLLQGCDCVVDFINERDHDFIEKACQAVNFPRERFRLFSLPPDIVRARLSSYDCGLVFISDGPWISMSSPTKIGEYLAAGLHVIGLSGIAALDRLAAGSLCVDVLKRDELGCQLSAQQAREIIERIKNPRRPVEARKLAEQHYDRIKAVTEYVDLYEKILLCS